MIKYVVMVEEGYDLPEVFGPFDSNVDATTFADDYEEGFGSEKTVISVVELLRPDSVVVE